MQKILVTATVPAPAQIQHLMMNQSKDDFDETLLYVHQDQYVAERSS